MDRLRHLHTVSSLSGSEGTPNKLKSYKNSHTSHLYESVKILFVNSSLYYLMHYTAVDFY